MAYHIVGKLKGKPFASKPHLTRAKADEEHKRLKKAGLKSSSVVPIKSLDEDVMKTLNELSARTLRSYARKATDDKNKVGKAIDAHPPFHQVATTSGEKAAWKSHGELNQKLRKHINRVTGVKKAEKKLTLRVVEDSVATNCAGSGAIKGIGTGSYPDSEPGVPKKRLKVILNKAKMLTRKNPNV